MGSHVLQARKILNDELFSGTRNNLIFFESAKNPARRFFRQTGHVGQVLMSEPDANSDAIRFMNAGSPC